jgi:hypothetical protein
MRRLPIVACLLALVAGRAEGQSLDIGGIQVRLGQNVADALRALSSYQARYSEDAKLWLVTQRGESQYELLGMLSATEGRISGITKVYNLSNQYDSQRVYTQASRELHRLGGNACETREVELADDQIHSIETRCGLYRLTYSFASTYQADNVGAGISINVSQR